MVKVQVIYYSNDNSLEPKYTSGTYEFKEIKGIDIYALLQDALGDTHQNIFGILDNKSIKKGLRFVIMEDGNENFTKEYKYDEFYKLAQLPFDRE